jgi:uncharacterized protein (TIGR03435 family)
MRLSLVAVFLAGGMLWGQSTGLRFEVASVRPTVFPNDAFAAGFRAGASSNPCTRGKLTVSGTPVSLTGAAICDIIRVAYDLKSYQVIGIPASLGYSGQDRNESQHVSVQAAIAGIASQPNIFYDVEARVPGRDSPDEEQVREMLRALLAERFQLKVHRESRELAYLALMVAKGSGPKVLPASPDCKPSRRPDTMAPCGQTMQVLAKYLNGYADRQVIDMTGYTDKFDYEIPIDRSDRDFGAALTAAIQEKLGLKLEARKGPVEVLVVDRVEKPSDN